MTVSTNISDLATRIGTEFKTIRTEMASIGGGLPIGAVAVRYDNDIPQVACLWAAPDGSLVLIKETV